MKKNWNNPELKNLGVNSTNEDCGHTDDCTAGDDKGLLIHSCDYCGELFWTHCEEVKHEKICDKNPSKPQLS